MGLMSEWKAFYNLASRYLGMPDLDSRLTSIESAKSRHSSNKFGSGHDSIADFMFHDSRFDKQADRIMELVLESGNFGHNNDLSYRSKYTGMKYKAVAMWRRFMDFTSLIPVFPLDAPRFFVGYLLGKKMQYAGETI